MVTVATLIRYTTKAVFGSYTFLCVLPFVATPLLCHIPYRDTPIVALRQCSQNIGTGIIRCTFAYTGNSYPSIWYFKRQISDPNSHASRACLSPCVGVADTA